MAFLSGLLSSLHRWRGAGPRVGPVSLQSRLQRALELVVDEEQLHGAIMGYFVDLHQAGRGALYLWHAETDRLQRAWPVGEALGPIVETLEGEGRLVRWLQVNEEPLRVGAHAAVVASLPETERTFLATLQADLCIPLVAMNRLIAVAVLGQVAARPLPELPPGILTQIGLALQNAVLYAQQQVRLRRLSRAERLATAGELAASAAHEIRNPLTAISSAVQLLGEAFPTGTPRHEVADSVMQEIDRINGIVEGLLSFARPPETKREAVHLAVVVDSAISLVATMAHKAGVTVVRDGAVERDVLRGDADQLRQVFVNLLMNGIQAMEGGGQLIVRVTRPGRLRVEVEDTGTGMKPEQVERAFDPFYTTKEKGTGLGLPICYGIVRGHGGDIDLDSAPGRGTTVRVEL